MKSERMHTLQVLFEVLATVGAEAGGDHSPLRSCPKLGELRSATSLSTDLGLFSPSRGTGCTGTPGLGAMMA
jgi:hypothetical protein